MVDLIFLYFTFHFYFHSVLFSIFYFQNNQGQGGLVTLLHQSQYDGIVTRQIMRLERTQQRIHEQITLYNMDTTCWPHGLHMVVQGRVHSSQHEPSVRLYKVDQFVKEFSIEFSCVFLIQESFYCPPLRLQSITAKVYSVAIEKKESKQ